MSDLISREALLRKMNERYCKIDNGRAFKGMTIPVVDGVRMQEIEYCIGMIQSEDAIEAEPVRHGEWVARKEIFDGEQEQVDAIGCSQCGKSQRVFRRTPYCPNCGAKMGGAEE